MADITIASNISGFSDDNQEGAFVYYANVNEGIAFYMADNDIKYALTLDGGATWGSETILEGDGVNGSLRGFADQQNPVIRDTRNLVHVKWSDRNGDVWYAKFNGSTLAQIGGVVSVGNGGSISLSDEGPTAMVVSNSGHIYIGSAIALGTQARFISTDDGDTWSSNTYDSWWDGLSGNPVGEPMGMDTTNTGDDDDVAALFGGYGTEDGNVYVRVFDQSANQWHSNLLTTAETSRAAADGKGFMGQAARTDKHMLVAVSTLPESSGAGDIEIWDVDIDGVSSITATQGTNVLTATAHSNIHVQIDHGTERVYVHYQRGSDSYYKYTDDWGTTWSAEQPFTTDNTFSGVGHTVASASGGGRIQPVYINTTSGILFTAAGILAAGATSDVVLTGTLVPSNNEGAVAAGGPTLIATVTGNTWDADIDNDAAESEDFISALVSAGAEALGWNNVIVGKFYRKEVISDSPLMYLRLGGNLTDQGSAAVAASGTALTVGAALLLSSAQPSSVFNAATAKVEVTDEAGIQNIWDGGGTAEIIARPWASGFSLDQSKLYSKIDAGAGWELILDNQQGAYVDISLRVDFSTAQGVWKVAGKVPIGQQTHIAVTYNSGATTNVPTFYINGQPHTPVTEQTPVGTRSSDAGSELWIGSNSSPAVTFNGELQEAALYGGSLTAARIQAHVLAASNRYGLRYTALVRTSATVVTLTLPPFPFYDISVAETITATFPTTVFGTPPSSPIVATPTFQITPTSRKTNFVPPVNPFATQTPGPFGNINGGLGPAAGDAFRILGAGDTWNIGMPQMAIGLAGSANPRILLIRATEITATSDDD